MAFFWSQGQELGLAFGTDTTIRAILVNPIYAGDMVWNHRTDARFHRISDGKAVESGGATLNFFEIN
ncbi:MAG: recombinase family protein [Planctomycetota bacterium]|jgi:hypothetical protein